MKTALAPDEHGHDSEPPPAGLMEAFEAYETALLTNDVAALDALFAPGPDTLRGDGTTLLVGHDAIAGFRAGRTVVPTRRVRQVQVRALAADLALVMAVTADPDTGGSGLQTQIWRRTHDAWRITAAHVTLPPKDRPAFDPSVWRVVGDPLLQPTEAGPLDGTTVAVKDLFALAGQRIGAGNPTTPEFA